MSLIPIRNPGFNVPEVAFLQTAEDVTNTNIYTFSGENLGAARSGRRIICLIAARRNADGTMAISSATIGGITATTHITSSEASGNPRIHFFIISAAVPTGTTGDVQISFDQVGADCKIHLYRADNLISGTPTATASNTTDPISTTIDVTKNSILVGGGYLNATGAVTTVGVTEDHDAVFDTTKRTVCGSASRLAAEIGRTVSFSQGGSSLAAGAWATWR